MIFLNSEWMTRKNPVKINIWKSDDAVVLMDKSCLLRGKSLLLRASTCLFYFTLLNSNFDYTKIHEPGCDICFSSLNHLIVLGAQLSLLKTSGALYLDTALYKTHGCISLNLILDGAGVLNSFLQYSVRFQSHLT